MPIPLRAASAADAPLLARLNGPVQELHCEQRPDWFQPTDPADIAAWFTAQLTRPGAHAWIAEVDGEPAGYVLALPVTRDANPFAPARSWLELDQIAVLPTFRRQGVARALVARVIEHADAAGIPLVELATWAFNTDAQRLFAAMGFKPRMMRFERHAPRVEPAAG